MRVGIVTIVEKNMNYGNKLQNYASIKILSDMGFETKTLVFEEQRENIKIHIKRIVNKMSGCRLSRRQHIFEKQDAFYMFDKKYLHMSTDISKESNLKKYDYFCVGSDQVWNPSWYTESRKKYFWLTFAKPEQKVCMAPSIGLDKLPDEWKDYFSRQLLTFPYLSVREESGARIIKELTGRDAEVVIDPTLMLSTDDWHKIAKKSPARKGNKPYILNYFLNRSKEDTASYISNIAKSHRLEIYELCRKENKELFSTGPSEFIDLIDHAELICTDSFHACVFSILFNKPFLVFERNGANEFSQMGSRITGLMTLLGLEKKLPENITDENLFEHDYSDAYIRLNEEREKAMNFLKRSFGIK